MWELAPAQEALATLSVAAVLKANGRDLRLFLMSVPFNLLLRPLREVLGEEPAYGLDGGAALGQLSCPDDDFAAAAFDESNAFSMVETLAWWPFMAQNCLPPGPGAAGPISGHTVQNVN